MASLKVRHIAVNKCLDALKESLDVYESSQYTELHKQLRDSVIRRFKFTIDIFWGFLREYLESTHGVVFALVSPREVLRAGLTARFLKGSEFELFERMLQDRNLTSHTYNEFLAEEISSRISSYYTALKNCMLAVKAEELE